MAKAKTRSPVKRLRHRNAVSVPQNPTGSKAKNLARGKSKHNRNKAEKERDDLAALEQEALRLDGEAEEATDHRYIDVPEGGRDADVDS